MQVLLVSSYIKPEKEGFSKRSDWIICLGYAFISAKLMLINVMLILYIKNIRFSQTFFSDVKEYTNYSFFNSSKLLH